MLGLAQREAQECRRCGGDLAETTDYANRYVPQAPIVCLQCLALHQSEKDHAKEANAAAMIHYAKRVDRPKPKPRSRRKRRDR